MEDGNVEIILVLSLIWDDATLTWLDDIFIIIMRSHNLSYCNHKYENNIA